MCVCERERERYIYINGPTSFVKGTRGRVEAVVVAKSGALVMRNQRFYSTKVVGSVLLYLTLDLPIGSFLPCTVYVLPLASVAD